MVENYDNRKGAKGQESRLKPKSKAMVSNNTSTLFLLPSVTPLTACRAAPGLVPLLGQDWLSSTIRTQLVLRCSCGRTGRSGKGNGGCWCAVNVQCLSGPLLGVPEMFRKAERIRLKDFSQRDVTSSGAIPFVSIFGRIFNLMVPVQVGSGA